MSTTSRSPILVRWYAMLQPRMPPPMMTMRARVGMGLAIDYAFTRLLVGSYRGLSDTVHGTRSVATSSS